MLPIPDTLTHSKTTEYRATQLVESIKFKLSHANSLKYRMSVKAPRYICAGFLLAQAMFK